MLSPNSLTFTNSWRDISVSSLFLILGIILSNHASWEDITELSNAIKYIILILKKQ